MAKRADRRCEPGEVDSTSGAVVIPAQLRSESRQISVWLPGSLATSATIKACPKVNPLPQLLVHMIPGNHERDRSVRSQIQAGSG